MNECPYGLFDVCCTNYDNCSMGEPKKEWVGLTEDDAIDLLPNVGYEYEVDVEVILAFAKAIEARLKEKNNG